MQVSTFGVIGAGQMGGGIAQVAAASGLNVILHDISSDFVEDKKCGCFSSRKRVNLSSFLSVPEDVSTGNRCLSQTEAI